MKYEPFEIEGERSSASWVLANFHVQVGRTIQLGFILLIDISFFVPTFNSEKTVLETIASIQEAVLTSEYSHEIVVVDDQSSDRTVKIVEEYARVNSTAHVRILQNKRRSGLGYSFLKAVEIADGRFFKMVHSGNIESADQIGKYLRCAGAADVIAGYINDSRAWHRSWLSSGVTAIMSVLSGYSLKYFQGSNLYFRKDLLGYDTKNTGSFMLAELLIDCLNRDKTYLELELELSRPRRENHAISMRNLTSLAQCIVFVLKNRWR